MRGRRSVVAVVLLGLATLGACTDDAGAPEAAISASPSATAEPEPVRLTFGVYGAPAEVNAYRRVAGGFNAFTDQADVRVKAYSTLQDLTDAVESGSVPDVFLISRDDVADLRAQGLTQPLSAMLDERGVDIGDDYSRDALEAFSLDRDLQCMPYSVSPDVVFYNTRWVNFDRMAQRELPTPRFDPENPRQAPRWTFEMFAAAANFATRPRRNVSGFHIDPTLRGLAPFIYSGGGQVFDDDDDPTSLALSDDGSRQALETVLPLLRDASLTLSDDQLLRDSPLGWFEAGRLGMIVGSRSLVPQLREVEGLDFDVLPMPSVDGEATVGDLSGICVSGTTKHASEAADFLVHAISSDAVRQVVQAGYLTPANQSVALSDAFLQPSDEPLHSSVFVSVLRSMVIEPLVADPEALDDATSALIASLVTTPLLDRDGVDALTTQIDEASRTVLAPEDPGAGQSDAPDELSENDSG